MTVYSMFLGKEFLAAQIMFSTTKNMLIPIGESVGYCARRYMNQIFLDRGYRSAKRVAFASIVLIFVVAGIFVGTFYMLKVFIIDEWQFRQNLHDIFNQTYDFFIIYMITDMLKDVIRNI